MKKTSLIFLFFLFGLFITGWNQSNEKKISQNTPQTVINAPIPVEGSWQLVWAEYNDQLADTSNHYIFKQFCKGAFSLIAYDSTKKINFAGYGKYEFDGGVYHETFIYHNNPQYVGAEDWQDLTVRGDTMYMNGLKKVVVGGKDVTVGWSNAREKLVRVKMVAYEQLK